MPDLDIGTPEGLISHLWKRMDERAGRIKVYERYYNGDQDLRFTTSKAREVFGEQFSGFADNFCALVVDAVDERLEVRGFRVGEDEAATTAIADFWSANDMAGLSQMVHLEALVNEESYAIVWLDPETKDPVITVESPFEVITEHDPALRRRRTAALKRWYDPDAKRWYACLYQPNEIRKYRQSREANNGSAEGVHKKDFWEPWQPKGEEWPLPNPLGIVPVVPFVNLPRLGPGQRGTSEIASVLPLQDAVNKTIFDMLIASEFAAFPQRYMVGVEQPVDPVTGQPREPFKAGVDRIWFIETDGVTGVNPAVGQFAPANLTPYVDSISMYVGHIAGISKTPKHYLIDPGGGTNLSGETVKALEAGLVSKTRRKHNVFGPAWEEVVSICLRLQDGGPYTAADAKRVKVEWMDPETRTEAQHIDALVKLGQAPLSVPKRQLWKDAGYTEDQIREFEAMEAAEPPAPAVPPAAPVSPGTPGAPATVPQTMPPEPPVVG